DDFRTASALVQNFNPLTRQAVTFWTYALAIPNGVLLADETALRETAETLELAERNGDNATLFVARWARGVTLIHRGGHDRAQGLELLASIRDDASLVPWSLLTLPVADAYLAQESARIGDFDSAVGLSRRALETLNESGRSIWCGFATTVLVETLLQRGGSTDLGDAQLLVDRLAAVPTDPGFVLHDITLLRLCALLARARGDEAGYRDLRDRYRAMANDLGFEGHMAMAAGM
ncbi:MAG: cyclase, partial [Mycobacterium sp.]